MVTVTHDAAIDTAVATLKFLSDKNRLRILTMLTRAEMCVCDLMEGLNIPQPLLSYHLGKLKQAGLVRTRREAQWIYYSLDPDAWRRMVEPLGDLLTLAPLPPEAAFGAGRHCDIPPPTRS
jgi:ArsR family transcriptional regulator